MLSFACSKRLKNPHYSHAYLEVYHQTLGYSIVRKAEEAKIALSDEPTYLARIALSKELLEVNIGRDQLIDAIESPKAKMIELVKEAVTQGGVQPDAIFVTGGSARSPILHQAIQEQLPNIPIVRGDDFGSVTAGLARWAQTCFK